MKILIEKSNLGVHGCTPSDGEALEKLKNGVYQAEIKKPRNVKFHRKFFSLLNLAFSMQDEILTFDAFRDAVTIKAGHYDTYRLTLDIGDVIVCKPKSISFAQMDDTDFDRFYSTVIDVLIQNFCPGQTYDEMDEAAKRYLDYA